MRSKVADEWLAAKRDVELAQARLDAIEARFPEMSVGDVLEGSTGKVRKCGRSMLVSDLLKAKVSPSMWTSITERKPVAVLYHAAVRRGKLDQSTLDECSKPTKTWFEAR